MQEGAELILRKIAATLLYETSLWMVLQQVQLTH
jgi:hypothetical protein